MLATPGNGICCPEQQQRPTALQRSNTSISLLIGSTHARLGSIPLSNSRTSATPGRHVAAARRQAHHALCGACSAKPTCSRISVQSPDVEKGLLPPAASSVWPTCCRYPCAERLRAPPLLIALPARPGEQRNARQQAHRSRDRSRGDGGERRQRQRSRAAPPRPPPPSSSSRRHRQTSRCRRTPSSACRCTAWRPWGPTAAARP